MLGVGLTSVTFFLGEVKLRMKKGSSPRPVAVWESERAPGSAGSLNVTVLFVSVLGFRFATSQIPDHAHPLR